MFILQTIVYVEDELAADSWFWKGTFVLIIGDSLGLFFLNYYFHFATKEESWLQKLCYQFRKQFVIVQIQKKTVAQSKNLYKNNKKKQ